MARRVELKHSRMLTPEQSDELRRLWFRAVRANTSSDVALDATDPDVLALLEYFDSLRLPWASAPVKAYRCKSAPGQPSTWIIESVESVLGTIGQLLPE